MSVCCSNNSYVFAQGITSSSFLRAHCTPCASPFKPTNEWYRLRSWHRRRVPPNKGRSGGSRTFDSFQHRPKGLRIILRAKTASLPLPANVLLPLPMLRIFHPFRRCLLLLARTQETTPHRTARCSGLQEAFLLQVSLKTRKAMRVQAVNVSSSPAPCSCRQSKRICAPGIRTLRRRVLAT